MCMKFPLTWLQNICTLPCYYNLSFLMVFLTFLANVEWPLATNANNFAFTDTMFETGGSNF